MRAAAAMHSRKKHAEDTIEESASGENLNQQRRYIQTQINAAVREGDYREAARLKKTLCLPCVCALGIPISEIGT